MPKAGPSPLPGEGEGLTGSKIYLSLLLALPFGVGDEKKNRSFAFNPSGNGYLVHPFSPRRKGRFSVSTGLSLLQFFWGSEISGKEASSCFLPQGFGWEPGFPEQLQRETRPHHFLGHLV